MLYHTAVVMYLQDHVMTLPLDHVILTEDVSPPEDFANRLQDHVSTSQDHMSSSQKHVSPSQDHEL